MERGFWLAVGLGLALLTGCGKQMSYGDLDATRVNALNALDRANEAYAKADELESRVGDLESRVDDLESRLE